VTAVTKAEILGRSDQFVIFLDILKLYSQFSSRLIGQPPLLWGVEE
jgi:hypothetical protein